MCGVTTKGDDVIIKAAYNSGEKWNVVAVFLCQNFQVNFNPEAKYDLPAKEAHMYKPKPTTLFILQKEVELPTGFLQKTIAQQKTNMGTSIEESVQPAVAFQIMWVLF